MVTITVEDYCHDPAKRRLADEIMARFDLSAHNGIEMRISEGQIEFDWVWIDGPPSEWSTVHTTLITARSNFGA